MTLTLMVFCFGFSNLFNGILSDDIFWGEGGVGMRESRVLGCFFF